MNPSHLITQDDLTDVVHTRSLLQARLLSRLFSGSLNRHLKLALKGGMAMRVAHGVQRPTKDIDLDADTGTSLDALRAVVRRSIKSALSDANLPGMELSEPKQTATTARWKIFGTLPDHDHVPFTLTVEVSMREVITHDQMRFVPLAVDGYQVEIPVWNDEKLYLNKCCALLSPVRNAPRDVLDLDVLVRASVSLDAKVLRTRLMTDHPELSAWKLPEWSKLLWDRLESFDERRFQTEILSQWVDHPMPTWDDWQEVVMRVGTALEVLLATAFGSDDKISDGNVSALSSHEKGLHI